jgi:Tlde1 domain
MIDPLGLCWICKQSTGEMFHNSVDSVPVGTGYAGRGAGLKNPSCQDVGTTRSAWVDDPANAGPLPQGSYTIGPRQLNVTHEGIRLPASMRVFPKSGNQMFGRSGFLIHGDFAGDVGRMASKGCIILPRNVRNKIGHSGDKCLEVVP